jgi:type I restriction enzyme M protein
MATESSTIVQRLWNYCNVLRDGGMSFGDYVEQLTYHHPLAGKIVI